MNIQRADSEPSLCFLCVCVRTDSETQCARALPCGGHNNVSNYRLHYFDVHLRLSKYTQQFSRAKSYQLTTTGGGTTADVHARGLLIADCFTACYNFETGFHIFAVGSR